MLNRNQADALFVSASRLARSARELRDAAEAQQRAASDVLHALTHDGAEARLETGRSWVPDLVSLSERVVDNRTAFRELLTLFGFNEEASALALDRALRNQMGALVQGLHSVTDYEQD